MFADTQPPVIDYCESPPEFISHTNQLSLEWDEPLFHDNSKKPLTVTQSHDFGFLFPFGETNVEYTAKDASGNSASCIITVKLSSIETIHGCIIYLYIITNKQGGGGQNKEFLKEKKGI